MTKSSDKCSACGRELESRTITYTKEHNCQLVAIGSVPAKVCRKCGDEYFTPEVVDELHRIIQGNKWTKTLKVPYAQMQSSS